MHRIVSSFSPLSAESGLGERIVLKSGRDPVRRYGSAIVDESAAGDCRAVHRPLTDMSVIGAQQYVALAITAEIADAHNPPTGSHGTSPANEATANDIWPIHLPKSQAAVGVLPQEIALVIAIEIADAREVPVRRHYRDAVIDEPASDNRGAVQRPFCHSTVDVLPEYVTFSIAAEIGNGRNVPIRR